MYKGQQKVLKINSTHKEIFLQPTQIRRNKINLNKKRSRKFSNTIGQNISPRN